jgi:phenylacetate-CoA ligase
MKEYPKYYNENMETMPREEMHKLKEKKLSQAIKRACDNPFYKKKFKEVGANPEDIQTIEDLKKLPFTTKEDLRESQKVLPPFGNYCSLPMEDISMINASSGTTGDPTAQLISFKDMDIWKERSARFFWAIGVRPNDICQNTLNFQLFGGVWWIQFGLWGAGATVIPFGVGSSQRQLLIMKNFGATLFLSTPSYAMALAEKAKEHGFNIERDFKLRFIGVGAEPGGSIPNVRKRIEELWKVKVHDVGGQSEAQGWYHSCEEQTGCHIIDDHFIIEFIDPDTKKTVGPGKKAVAVITHLDRRAQGLIRWWSNDLTYYEEDYCPCGRTSFILPRGVIGRGDDMLKVKGVRIWPAGVEEVLRSMPNVGEEFQIILDDTNVLESGALSNLNLRVESRDDVTDKEKLVVEVASKIKAHLNVKPEVEIVHPGTLPRFEMKAKRIIDLRKDKSGTH